MQLYKCPMVKMWRPLFSLFFFYFSKVKKLSTPQQYLLLLIMLSDMSCLSGLFILFFLHCKCLHTNYRLTIVFICYYYIWKCVKCLQVVEFEYYTQKSVFSAVNSKLHSNYWYLDVKWKCILIPSEIRYISWQFLQLKICNWFTIQGKYK